jgi:hypothetical protein
MIRNFTFKINKCGVRVQISASTYIMQCPYTNRGKLSTNCDFNSNIYRILCF